jgi:branched-chain amino acid transport system substrate-binding protein
MEMSRRLMMIGLVACLFPVFTLSFCGPKPPKTVKIGLNAPLTGSLSKIGESTKYATQLWTEETNAAGGIEVAGKRYPVEWIIADGESNDEAAAKVNLKMIMQDEVLVIVGPPDSKEALSAGEEANKHKTPMISPWSDNPKTTQDRPYVFRACFLNPLQGPICANFIKAEFAFNKAAVLYDIAGDEPKSIAESFRDAWEKMNGPGTVVAYENFTTKDMDFSSQLIKIFNSEAEVLFVPQYADQVAQMVQQAHQLGWKKPIVGTHYLNSSDLIHSCGSDCQGLFFSTHYVTIGTTGAAKEFIEKYKTKYGSAPDEIAALTWDSMGIIKQALKDCNRLSGDLDKNRQCLRDALVKIKDFEGITGKITFNGTGDPVKCAVIAKINDKGEFEFYKSICP